MTPPRRHVVIGVVAAAIVAATTAPVNGQRSPRASDNAQAHGDRHRRGEATSFRVAGDPQVADHKPQARTPFADCNSNGIPDETDIFWGTSLDCNSNGVPDECDAGHNCCDTGHGPACDHPDIAACVCNIDRFCCSGDWDYACVELVMGQGCGLCNPDCNGNSIPDDCDIDTGPSLDCNTNTILDECEIEHDCCQTGHGAGCGHAIIEACVCGADRYCCSVEWDEICVALVTSEDCGPCDPDCNTNLIPDDCDVAAGTTEDCNSNGIPDECDPPGDFDADGDYDLYDYASFADCLTGPGEPPAACCRLADFDGDEDIDLGDFGEFQRIRSTVCANDGDCDDELFCTGVETCIDIGTSGFGVCAAGTDPCEPDEICDEGGDACIPTEPMILDLTPANDTLTGGAGDDYFDGSRDAGLVTLNNGDVLDGGAGTDTLYAEISANLTPQVLAGIEVFDIVPLAGGLTLLLPNANSVTTISFENPPGVFSIGNAGAAVSNVSISNSTFDFTMTVDDQVLTGGNDNVTLALDGVTDIGSSPRLAIQPIAVGVSGYEIIGIESTGSIANSVDQLVDDNGDSFATLEISGARGLTIDQALGETVTTVDGSGSSGSIDVTLGDADVAITGGSASDTFRFAGTFDANDTVNGGGGSWDRIESTDEDFTGTVGPQGNVSNVEYLATTDPLTGDLNASHWGVDNVAIAGKDDTARTITIPSGGTVEVTSDVGANDLDIALAGTDTTGDTLTVRLNATGGGTADFTGELDASGFELMTLMADGAPGGDGDYDLAAVTLNSVGGVTETITVTGAQNLDIGGQITAEAINASAFAGVFDNSDGTVAGAISITTGIGADLIDGSSGGDVINGGAGNDRIEGKAGSDMLTGGSDNDVYDFDAITLADTDQIADFDAGANTTTVDQLQTDLSTLNGLIGTLSDTSNNDAVEGDGTFVQLTADGQTIANADLVGLIGDYTNAANALANKASWTITFAVALDDNDAFMVAYTSGSDVRIALCEVNGASANSDAVDGMWDIAILTGVSLSNLDSGDYRTTD